MSQDTERDINLLKQCFEQVIWMAIRYANGRQTYAPTMVRDSIEKYRMVVPNWEPEPDPTVREDRERISKQRDGWGWEMRSDWLDDLC